VPEGEAAFIRSPPASTDRIVYTSGSTGEPKGVLMGGRQLAHAAAALRDASGAGPQDVHLSVLPYALLLESLCGLHVPLLAGASVRILRGGPPAAFPGLLARAAAEAGATTSVLTPQLLAAWTGALEAGLGPAPASLRFVAVGGAAAPEALLRRARAQGLPAFQGYGLTECGSVVAVNRPGADRPGSCGRPLPGVEVTIAEDGEIVVRSPSVMDGYLGSPAKPAEWRTGDLGALDADGYLSVRGRKDSLIVRPSGRNLSPEWLETMLAAEPRIARAAVTQAADGGLFAVLEPTVRGGEREIDVAALLAEAPAYAQPDRLVWLEPGGFAARGLLTANGRPRRAALQNVANPRRR
jgi:long-subunit acyl-CoA synthetase (AMP-forming)